LIFSQFFEFYVKWNWEKDWVSLNGVNFSNSKNWKKNPKKDLMVILTPTFPVKNIPQHLSKCTTFVIREEFEKASKMNGEEFSKKIFESSHNFFSLYKGYLRVTLASVTTEEMDIL
jgi:poly(A) polymerase Pap1